MKTAQKYNGMTIEEINNNLPKNMIEGHKTEYINNCKFVIKNEAAGYNIDYCQTVRNANFNLILFYMNHKN